MRRALLPVVLLALAASAGACKDPESVIVGSLTFQGVTSVDTSALRAVLATRVSSRLPWGKKIGFERQRLDADVKRVEAFYADRGFPDARVTNVRVAPRDSGRAVDLTVTVAEGRPVAVVAVNFHGFEVVPAAHLEQLRRAIPLEPGQPRDRQKVVAAHEMAVNELRDHGYPFAQVTTGEDDGADGRHATIAFTAVPGPLAHFGAIEVSGNTSVTASLIRRQLTYRPGDLYRRSVLQESQRRLYELQLFQFVTIDAIGLDRPGPEVATRVTVAEGKHQRVSFGVGYGTDEKGRVDAEYRHLDFLGGARTADVHGRWSSLDRGIRVAFMQPNAFAHVSAGADAQRWYTYAPAYYSIISGGRLTFTRRPSGRTSWSLSLASEHDTSGISDSALKDPTLRNDLIALGLDPRTGQQDGTLASVGFDLQRSTADDPLNARRGYHVGVHAEQAGRALPGSFNYDALSIDLRRYQPIGQRLVVAARLQAGTIDPAGGDQRNIPFSKLYFLGGAESLRGWGRYEVSPLSESGYAIGGDSVLEFSAELRAALRGRIGAVLFLDAGNVWADAWDVRPGDLRYAIGPGFRYQTPIGPLRFDVGYQLNPIAGLLVDGAPQTRRWRLHFSIGQAF